jgi:membrane-associated phospholipid phosphatase
MNSVLTVVSPVRTALMADGRTRYHSAKWISQISSPPVTGLLTLVLCARALQQTFFWGWTAVYATLASFLPMLFVYWLHWRGIVSDLNMNRREERFWPYLVFIGGACAGWLFLMVKQAPTLLLLLATIVVIQAISSFFITTQWKISAHCSQAATLMVFVLFVYGVTAVPLLVLLFLIAWSRVYLNRHTAGQTIGGIVMGGLTSIAVLTLAG